MKGMMFTETMYEAGKTGRKTKTFRLLPRQPDLKADEIGLLKLELSPPIVVYFDKKFKHIGRIPLQRSYHPKGMILYVKEPYYCSCHEYGGYEIDYRYGQTGVVDNQWKNKMFMPARYARAYIIIRDTQVRQLRDLLNCGDIILEGLSTRLRGHEAGEDLKRRFRELWESIHGRGSWERDRDKWGVQYTFEWLDTQAVRKVIVD